MPQSPRETLSPRETRSPSIVPENPMGSSEMSIMKSRVCEKLLLAKDVAPVLHIKAVWQRKDASTSAKRTSHGKIRREGKEMWAVWEDDPTREYPFPPNDLNYFRIDLEEAEPQSSNNLPETLPLNGGRPLPPSQQGVRINGIALKLDPYEPITWTARIKARNDVSFRIRDMIHGTEGGTGIWFADSVNSGRIVHFRNSKSEGSRNILGNIDYVGAGYPSDNQQVLSWSWVKQSFRVFETHIGERATLDGQAVHQKLDKKKKSHDKFYQHVSDQLSEKKKNKTKLLKIKICETKLSKKRARRD